MFVVYVCIYYFFKIYFIFLVARGIKPTNTCFQVLSSSPTQGGAGDRAGVCLLAEGQLDCSQSSSFPQIVGIKHITGGHLGVKCTGFSLGMTMKSSFGQRTQEGRTSGRFFGKIRNSGESSSPQANIPLAIILEQILHL